MLTRDGTYGNSVAATVAILVLAGVMLKRRALAIFTAAAAIVVLGIGYAEIAGLLHLPMSGFTTVRHVVGVCLIYVVAAIIARVLTESLFIGLREVREKGKEAHRARARLSWRCRLRVRACGNGHQPSSHKRRRELRPDAGLRGDTKYHHGAAARS
jgi:hypothetical protein